MKIISLHVAVKYVFPLLTYKHSTTFCKKVGQRLESRTSFLESNIMSPL
jgi:hypothetical protein